MLYAKVPTHLYIYISRSTHDILYFYIVHGPLASGDLFPRNYVKSGQGQLGQKPNKHRKTLQNCFVAA